MKTERRHELQENELATWLGQVIHTYQHYLRAALGVIILAALGLMASAYMNNRSKQTQEAAWSAYFEARLAPESSALKKVAETYSSTEAAGWALQSAGDLELGQGISELFRDKQQAAERLKGAEEAYEAVIASYQEPMLLKRAMLGLAKAQESQQNLEGAKQNYGAIISRWGADQEDADQEDQVVRIARSRLASLDSPNAEQWYAWFAQQEPPKSPLDDPGFFEGLPNVPADPNLTMPKPGQLLGGSETSDAEDEGAEATTDDTEAADPLEGLDLQFPATNDTPQSGESPSSESPSSESPSSESPSSE